MTEEKDNIGITTRVPAWVMNEIEAEINELPRPRPTRGEMLERAWRAYRAAEGVSEGMAGAVPRRYQKEVEKFIKIMQSGDVSAIKAVIANVEFFLDRLRPVSSDRK